MIKLTLLHDVRCNSRAFVDIQANESHAAYDDQNNTGPECFRDHVASPGMARSVDYDSFAIRLRHRMVIGTWNFARFPLWRAGKTLTIGQFGTMQPNT